MSPISRTGRFGRVDPGLILALLIALLAATPLLEDRYFFRAHDAPHSVFFLIEFDQSIRDGAFWPRWGTDFAFGYGYPLFNVYSPLSYFVAEFFLLAGLGHVGAVKATYLVAIVASAAGMYLLGRRLYGPAGGVVAAAVYTFLPYHLLDLYVRSAFAECFALLWLPFVLWGVLRLDSLSGQPSRGLDQVRAMVVAGLPLAGLVMSHNATALIVAPFLAVFFGWRLVEARMSGLGWNALGALTLRWTGAGGYALLLAAIFWLPLVAETRYVRVEDWTQAQFDFGRHFVYLHQFFAPLWSFGFSTPGPDDGMGFQLGLVALALGAFALTGTPISLPGPARRSVLVLATVAILVCAAMTPAAAELWRSLPGAALIQFPWRLLSLVILILSPLAGAAVAGLDRRIGDPAVATRTVVPIVAAIWVGGFGFVRVEPTPIRPIDVSPLGIIEFELQSPNIRTGMMIWSDEKPQTSPMVEQYRRGEPPQKWRLEGSGQVEQTRHGGESDEARVRAPNGGRLILQTYDYPGWVVRIDGEPVSHGRARPFGLIAIDVPPGDHVISARFEQTVPRLVGTGLSLSAVCLALVLFLGRTRGRSRRLRSER